MRAAVFWTCCISCTVSYGIPFLSPVSVLLEFTCVECWSLDEGSLLIYNYLDFAVRSHFIALVRIFSLIIIYFTQLNTSHVPDLRLFPDNCQVQTV